MKRRLAALLLALAAVFGVSVAAPQPAAADGIVGDAAEGFCRGSGAGLLGETLLDVAGVGGFDSAEMCDAVGDAADKMISDAWNNVWDSLVGDIIESAKDVTKWVVKKVLTFALLGPSLDLEGTGLWDGKATLAGMLTWLGLVIAAAGVMWNVGKMAVTGQGKHLARAMAGWVENIVLSALGVSLFALLLVIGDTLSAGLVNATFADDGNAYERIILVLLPDTVSNPITMLCVVGVLLLIGFIQLIVIFLRQSAIPIICLLIPVAAGGRTGGKTTRKWAPSLITTGMVIVAYKPILAVIICTGFAEFGHSKTLVEWLRGCATLILAILAPGPLTKIFAPFGAAAGAGMSAGGASGALSAAAGYIGGKFKDRDSDGGGDGPTDAVSHSRYVEQQMGRQGQSAGGQSGQDGSPGGDAQAQAARNEAGARVPGQAGADGAPGADAAGDSTARGSSTAAAGASTGRAAAGAGAAGVGIQVLDGVNDSMHNTINSASGHVGGGSEQ